MNFRTDKELTDYMTKLGEVRSQYPSLTRGTIDVLFEKNGMAVYKRVYENETAVIAINNTMETQTVTIPVAELADEKELRGMLNGDMVRSNDKQYRITIDRDLSEIYLLSDKSGINISYIIAMAVVWIGFAVFIYLVWKRSKRQKV